jgi:hypothetical protein
VLGEEPPHEAGRSEVVAAEARPGPDVVSRRRVLQLIHQEIANKNANLPARIIAKMALMEQASELARHRSE